MTTINYQEIAQQQQEMFDARQLARTWNYRKLQQELKTLSDKGFSVDVKLNSKKDVLLSSWDKLHTDLIWYGYGLNDEDYSILSDWDGGIFDRITKLDSDIQETEHEGLARQYILTKEAYQDNNDWEYVEPQESIKDGQSTGYYVNNLEQSKKELEELNKPKVVKFQPRKSRKPRKLIYKGRKNLSILKQLYSV